MSIFTDAEKLLSATLADTFAERVRIVPQMASRVVVGKPDPNRPAFVVRGTLLLDNEYDTASGAGTRNGTTPGVMVATNILTIEVSQIVEARHKVAARRGRLVRPIDDYPVAMRELNVVCAWRARDHAAGPSWSWHRSRR